MTSCVLGCVPCSAGFTLARSSATSGLTEGEASGSSAAKQRRRRRKGRARMHRIARGGLEDEEGLEDYRG